MAARFSYYQGKDSQWYWQLIDGNNQIVAIGGEGYVTEYNVKRAIKNVLETVPIAELPPL